MQYTSGWRLLFSHPLLPPYYLFSPLTVLFMCNVFEKLWICLQPHLPSSGVESYQNQEFETSSTTLTIVIHNLQMFLCINTSFATQRYSLKSFLLVIFLICQLYFMWLPCSICNRLFKERVLEMIPMCGDRSVTAEPPVFSSTSSQFIIIILKKYINFLLLF